MSMGFDGCEKVVTGLMAVNVIGGTVGPPFCEFVDEKVGSLEGLVEDCGDMDVGKVGVGGTAREDCTDCSDSDFLFCHVYVVL